jgi:GH24 family phage-related lysozyme (muramidase)
MDGTKVMGDLLESLTAMLKRHEGLELTMYYDSVSVPTIGYGHNLREPISLEAAHKILCDDIELVFHELDREKPFWRHLPHEVRLVIANMCFNLGWPDGYHPSL